MGRSVLSLALACVFLWQSSGMLSHVEQFEVVRPHRLLGRQRRAPGGHQLYPDTLCYEFPIEGKNVTIHLEKNRDLFRRGYTETHYEKDGRRVTSSPEEHCYYHGYVEGRRDSSVSVDLCSGINGFLKTREQAYLIQPLGRSDDGEHAVFRQEQLKVVGLPSSSALGTSYDGDLGLFRSRSRPRPRPRISRGIMDAHSFVELFVVVDNTEFRRYGTGTRARVLGAVNHMDKLYRALGIRVVLVGLEIWTDQDRFEVDSSSDKTLDKFLLWRRSDLLLRAEHDNAQFVTGKDLDGDTVGLANKFAMCTENSGGVNQDHHDNPIGLASTIAHEMGHNLGLSHDEPGCTCGPSHGDSNCVMADKLRTGDVAFPELFSDCSLKQLDEFMARAQPSCLSKPPVTAETVAVVPLCGNLLLDAGEECDCGSAEECNNSCCDPSTCRLTRGSQCSRGPCCEDCQLKPAGSVCRAAAGECDLADYCTGASEDCPENDFEMNGKPCYDRAEGYCHDGRCPTHQQHCWRLFGSGAVVGPDLCFNLNQRGEDGANCGRNKYGFTRCTPQNLKCGSMFCGGGGESITGKRADYTVLGIECKVAVDEDKSRNMDMVPDGARCGPNKVCLGHRCVDASVYGTKEECSQKCSNNGVCNHRKECHCDPGWAPPYCNVRYSELPRRHGQAGLVAGVCTILIVLLLISGGIVWWRRSRKARKENYTAQRKVHSAPGKPNAVFRPPGPRDTPQISEPTFMESTAAQACTPLTPSRAPPQRAAVKQAPPPLPPVKPGRSPAARLPARAPPQPPSRPKTKPHPLQ